jgi:hypothetical protein
VTAIAVGFVKHVFLRRLLRIARACLIVVGGLAYAGGVQSQVVKPDCDAMAAWAGGFDRNDEWQPNAFGNRHKFPRLFAEEETAALFGKPMVSWTEAEVMSVRETVLSCRKATQDRNLSGTYNAMQSALVNRVVNFSKAVVEARAKAAAAMETLQSQPPALPLLSFHSDLTKASTAEGYAQLQRSANGLPAALVGAARELVNALRDLPEAEIESIVAEPASRTVLVMREAVVEALLADVQQVPVGLQGLGLLDRMAQALPRDYADALGAETTETLMRAVNDRHEAVAVEIASELVADIGQSSADFDAFGMIDELTDSSLLQRLPQAQAERVRSAAQARRQAVSDTLFKDTSTKLAALPANDASLDSVDAILQSIAAWPASAESFKPRFEEGARKRKAEILGVINKAEAGAMRGRIYETADKTHRFEFVDRTRVFIHEPGHTAAGAYTEEKDGRVTVTVNGESTVLTREGRRLLGWHTPVSRTK